jgi:hypothetical protein
VRIFLVFMLVYSSSFAVQGPSAFFDDNDHIIINHGEIEDFSLSIKHVVESVTLHCHTDSRGSVEYNMSLAEKRCQSVEILLTKHKIKTNITWVFGESALKVEEVGSTINRMGRMGINRTVDILYELKETETVTMQVVKPFLRHRVQLAVGFGPDGLKNPVIVGPNTYNVSEDMRLLLGMGYSYRITERLNIGFEMFTNRSVVGTFGVDF